MMVLLEQIARYIDPVAIAIVFGGTLTVIVLRFPRADLRRAILAFRPLLHAEPHRDAAIARHMVHRIRRLAEARSIACVDRIHTAQHFLMRAARELSEARCSTDFSRWSAAEIDERRRRHQRAIAVWRAVADTAPAMGMIGTILGLVRMFAEMEDPAAVGPAMAVAMLTTLYGVILSAAVAGPIAGRLETLSDAELAWQSAACAQLELLARAELDGVPPTVHRGHLRSLA